MPREIFLKINLNGVPDDLGTPFFLPMCLSLEHFGFALVFFLDNFLIV